MTKTLLYGRARLSLLFCLTGLLGLTAPNLRAQEQSGQAAPDQQPAPDQAAPADQPGASATEDATDQNDPPTRVARISYLDGSVSLQPGGQGDWGAATRNRPLTIGDKIWTDKDSRAELQTGVMSIHLGSMTALSFLNLDQTVTQMRLPEGSINFRVKEIREGDTFEVDTPNLAFVVKQAGAFRIDVNENGDSTGVTVIRGAGTATANGQTYDIAAGQRGVFNGTDNQVQAQVVQAPPGDGLDQWANQRDLREQDSVSARYVPPDTPGTEDLDTNGTWSQQPDVGNVWYPNEVAPGWAPYSYGYWSYVGPWGWTWVDYAPWGFAPFHYGRWGWWGGRWGWAPGPIIGPAVYGPAFVGFLGGGFGFGFGIGIGVGWFPLGWGEPFHPWYHYGPHYAEFVNVHNTFIRNVNVVHGGGFNYAYAHNVHAVTAMSRSGFASGAAVNRGAAHITEASLRGATVSNHVGVNPTRQSSLGASNMRGNIARPSSAVENRSVVARNTPARGASNAHVQQMNTQNLRQGSFSGGNNGRANTANTARNGNTNTRSWSAQGNATDRGRAPQGFGNNGSANRSSQSAMNRGDRPPWAGSGSSNNTSRGGNQGSTGNRSYQPAQRSNAYGGQRSGNPAPSRTYSAPSRSYGGTSRPSGGGSSHASAPHASAPHGGGGGGHPHR
jgi:hypothetical protein